MFVDLPMNRVPPWDCARTKFNAFHFAFPPVFLGTRYSFNSLYYYSGYCFTRTRCIVKIPIWTRSIEEEETKKKERKRKTVSCGIVFLAANQIEEGKRAKETNAGEVGKKTRNKAKREKNEWQRKREGIWKVRQEEGGVLRFSGRSRKKKKERKRFWLARTSLSAGGGQVND